MGDAGFCFLSGNFLPGDIDSDLDGDLGGDLGTDVDFGLDGDFEGDLADWDNDFDGDLTLTVDVVSLDLLAEDASRSGSIFLNTLMSRGDEGLKY